MGTNLQQQGRYHGDDDADAAPVDDKRSNPCENGPPVYRLTHQHNTDIYTINNSAVDEQRAYTIHALLTYLLTYTPLSENR